jgi:hypothetical protein
MVGIAKRLNAKIERFSASAVTDFTRVTPILFVDAESIRKLGESSSRFPKAR